jgi:hypothetical protein
MHEHARAGRFLFRRAVVVVMLVLSVGGVVLVMIVLVVVSCVVMRLVVMLMATTSAVIVMADVVIPIGVLALAQRVVDEGGGRGEVRCEFCKGQVVERDLRVATHTAGDVYMPAHGGQDVRDPECAQVGGVLGYDEVAEVQTWNDLGDVW